MVLFRAYLEPFVCERFKNDPHYRAGHLHILAPAPGTVVIGLHTPEMKKIAKEIAGSDLLAATLLQFASHKPRWFLATALAKNADRTRDFIRSSSLPIDIIKMYVRKARESFRTKTVQTV